MKTRVVLMSLLYQWSINGDHKEFVKQRVKRTQWSGNKVNQRIQEVSKEKRAILDSLMNETIVRHNYLILNIFIFFIANQRISSQSLIQFVDNWMPILCPWYLSWLFLLIFLLIKSEAEYCELHPDHCCYGTRCAEFGDSSFTDPTGEQEGCLEPGCCQSWCQCFMGFSFFR